MYSFALESLRGRLNTGHRNVTVMQSHFCNNRATVERPYFSLILLQICKWALWGCYCWLEEVNFCWIWLYADPFCILLFFWDSECFGELFWSDPAHAVCSVSSLHHSTATLSSTSLPFKHEGEMKLNVHIRGRWLVPVLQWYLREIFFMSFQQHRRKWKCFLL